MWTANNFTFLSFYHNNYLYSSIAFVTMKQKAKIIFLPCLFLSISFVCIYTFLNWLLIIRLHLLDIDEEWLQLWIPFILGALLALVFIRPRLRILVKTKKGDFTTGFIVFASIAITAPAIPAQMYLETSTGQLTQLYSIHELNTKATTEYYQINNHFSAKNEAGMYRYTYISGKYGEDLNLNIFFATPIYDGLRNPESTHLSGAPEDGSVIFIVNGIQVTKKDIIKIQPDSASSIKVLKGKDAAALYGDSVATAVIVTLKNAQKPSSSFIGEPHVKEPVAKAWICVKYFKRISNHLSEAKKEEKLRGFFNQSVDNFNSRNLDSFVYLKLIPNSSDRRYFRKAVATLNIDADPKSLVMLEPKFAQFTKRNGNAFPWIFGWFAITSLLLFLLLLIPKVDEGKMANYQGVEQVPQQRTGSVNRLLVPKKGYYITPLLINSNLVIFLLMALSGDGFITMKGQALLNWGANYGPFTEHGQWWRLLTSMFVHEGIMHVLVNMYALLIAGIMLEPKLGKNRYFISYLATGITGSIFSLWMHTATISVGASGAIFGLYGTLTALMLTGAFPKKLNKGSLTGIVIFIIINLIAGLGAGIDNAAHVGGLLSGFIIGFALSSQLKREAEEKGNDKLTKEFLF